MERNLVRCTGHNIHQSAVHFTEGCWCFLFPLSEKSEMVRESSWATQSNGQRGFKKSKSRTQEAETFVFSCEWRNTDSPQIYLLIHVLIFLAHTTVVTHICYQSFSLENFFQSTTEICICSTVSLKTIIFQVLTRIYSAMYKAKDKAQIIVI